MYYIGVAESRASRSATSAIVTAAIAERPERSGYRQNTF
jgi:hypothetical protein